MEKSPHQDCATPRPFPRLERLYHVGCTRSGRYRRGRRPDRRLAGRGEITSPGASNSIHVRHHCPFTRTQPSRHGSTETTACLSVRESRRPPCDPAVCGGQEEPRLPFGGWHSICYLKHRRLRGLATPDPCDAQVRPYADREAAARKRRTRGPLFEPIAPAGNRYKVKSQAMKHRLRMR